MCLPSKPLLLARFRAWLARWLRAGWFAALPVWGWAETWLDLLVPAGDYDRRRRRTLLDLEPLEKRWLMAAGISEFPVQTGPLGITAGPDGNVWVAEGTTVQKLNTLGTVLMPTYVVSPNNPAYITPGPPPAPGGTKSVWFSEVILGTQTGDGIGTVPIPGSAASNYMVTPTGTLEIGVGGVVAGPDGNLWVTGVNDNGGSPPTFSYGVDAVNTAGQVVGGAALDTSSSSGLTPAGIAVGPDGNLWVADPNMNAIDRVTPSGGVTYFSTGLTANSGLYGITAGPDGNLWFTEASANKIGRITTSGAITEFTTGLTAGAAPHGIAVGPDGNLWFAERGVSQLGRITTSGAVYELKNLGLSGAPESVTLGPDGKLWFTEPSANKVGRLDYVEQAAAVGLDPFQGYTEPIPGQPGSTFAPNTGNLHVEVPLDFLLGTQQTDCGCNPYLVYNSDSVNVRPIISVQLMGVLGDQVPTGLQAQLTWNNGTPQPWVTVSTAGLSTSNPFYSFALQVGTPVTKTWVYPWTVEVQATLPGGGTIDDTLSGYAPVVVNDGNGGPGSDPVDPYGPGWTVRGVDRLVPVTGQSGVPDGVQYVYGLGESRFFIAQGNGQYLSPPNDFGTLTFNGTTYTYVAKNQITYNFNSSGQLITEVFPQNLTKTFTYTGGAISSIQEPDGGVGTFLYTGNLLTSVQEPGNRTVTIGRTTGGNGLSDLTSVNYPDNSLRTFTYDTVHRMLTDTRLPLLATYAYDNTAGVLSTITLAGGQALSVKPGVVSELQTSAAVGGPTLDKVTDALSHTDTQTADALGRLLQDVTADGATWTWARDFAGDVTSATDPRGNPTTYTYLYGPAGLGDLTQVSYPDGSTNQYQYDPTFHEPTVTVDGDGNRTTMTYDSAGDLKTLTDALNHTTAYTYYTNGSTPNGLVQTVTDPNGNVTSYAYDANRHVTTEIDGYGTAVASTTTMLYDAAGNLLSETTGQSVTATYAHPSTTSYAYDALRRVTKVIAGYGTPAAATTVYLYDNAGDQLSVTDPDGNVTSYAYDAAGRTTTEIDGYGSAVASTTTMIYDAAGNLLSETTGQSSNPAYAHPSTTSYGYDPVNRVSQQIDGYGTAAASTTTMLYDAAGNLLSETTGQSATLSYAHPSTTSYAYDALNRVTKTIRGYGSPAPATTTEVYDLAGNLLQEIDPNNNTTSYAYDALNRVTNTTRGAGTSIASTTTELFDAAGNLLSETTGQSSNPSYAHPSTTSYAYDALNRQTQRIDGYGTAVASTATMIYDAAGNLLSETTGQSVTATYAHPSTTSYAYDALNRQTAEVLAFGVSGQQRSEAMAYDAAGNLLSDTPPSGHPTSYAYDALNRRTSVTDPLNHTTTTAYDAAGEQVAVTDPNGNTTSYAYDALGRQTQTTDALNEVTTTVYDAADNQVSLTDADHNTTTMAYDALGRQTQTTDPLGHAATMAYDSGGRLTSTTDRDGRVRAISYDALDRETGETWSGTGVTPNTLTYTYDAAGNQLTSADANGAYTMAYDALNRVTAQQSPFGLSLSYFYDASGDRVRVQDSLGGVQVNAYDATGRLVTRTQSASGKPGTRIDLTYTPDGQVATQTDTALAAEDLGGLNTTAGSATVAKNQNTSPVTFTNLSPVSAPDAANLIDVTVADFNGDGLADVAAFDQSTGAWYVATSTGSGLGAFTEWTTPQTRWSTTVTWQVAAGDFTGDGKADLVGLDDQTGGLSVAVSTGSGFAAQQHWQTWSNTVSWVDFKVGNFSGHADGRVDLAARVLQNGAVYVSVGFDPTRDYTQSPDPQHFWQQWSTAVTWVGTTVGDLDGDGHADLVSLAQQVGTLWVSSAFDPTRDYSANPDGQHYWQTWSTGVTWVDFNAANFSGHTDGRVDLMARVQGADTVWLSIGWDPNRNYSANPDPQHLWAQWGTLATTWAYTVVGDFNGDGLADVASMDNDAGANQGNWYVWLSNGSGFATPASAAVNWSPAAGWQGVAAGAFVRRGVTVSYSYDVADRLTGITQSSSPGGSVLASYSYNYDPANRLTQETDSGAVTTYSYNAADELTQSGAVSYGYDAAGNRTNSGYQTGPGNQLTSDGTWTYTYDGEGNLTQKSKGANAETWTYTYNLRNQMVTAQDRATPGGTLLGAATYVYDVRGNRIEEDSWTSTSGVTTVTRSGYDDGGDAWADLNGSNAPVMRRVFLDGGQVAARVDASGNAAWYLSDHLGSVRAVVSYAGTTVLDRVAYDAYGNVTSESNASAGDAYKYAGGRYDAITGYTLFGARYYDAATGRWTSQDPIGFAGDTPNLYEYVGNDPTNAMDPSGTIDWNVNDSAKTVTMIVSIRYIWVDAPQRGRREWKDKRAPDIWDRAREQRFAARSKALIESAWNNGGYVLVTPQNRHTELVQAPFYRRWDFCGFFTSTVISVPYVWKPRLEVRVVTGAADFTVEVLANAAPAIPLQSTSAIGGGGEGGIDGHWDEADINPSSGVNNRGQNTVAHEFGHLIGLDHPGVGVPGVKDPYAYDATALMGNGNEMRASYYQKWALELLKARPGIKQINTVKDED